MTALCHRLGKTKGSFYHHFEDLPGFVMAFSAQWQNAFVERFDGFAAQSDVRQRLETIANGVFVIMSPGDRAMRAWARTNPTVHEAMLAPHHGAAAVSTATFAALAEDQDSGQVLAAMSLAMCIGIQHRPRPLDPEHFLRVVAKLYRGSGVNIDLLRLPGGSYLKVLPPRRVAPVTTTPGSLPASTLAEPTPSPPTTRATSARERYFAGARELLAEQGSDAVTTRTLADHLGLTKGSFGYHFGSMLEFQRALADHWEQSRTDRIARCRTERNPWRRLELLLSDLLIRPEQAETVWRAWGHANPIVGGALRRVDQRFENTLAITLAQLCDDDDPGLLAEMTLGFALGLHHWYPPFEPELMARAAIEWSHRFLGLDARLTTAAGHPALVFSRR